MPVTVATATGPLTETTYSATPGRKRIVIVGAGITGLALSARLVRRRIPHVVLERTAGPGGVIRSVRQGENVLDAGPQRTRLTPAIRALTRELGLDTELITAPAHLPLFVYRAGALRVAPLSFGQLLSTDLLSPAARLRILAEPFTTPIRYQETVAQYLIRRFGRDAYEDFLGPLFGGLYATDPASMLARHALLTALDEFGARRSAVIAAIRRGFSRRARLAACSFRSGMQALTDALYLHVREHVRLATPVLRIEKDGRGLRVHANDAVLAAHAVVMTCPAREAAMLLSDIAPAAATALQSLTYNPIAVAHLRSDARIRAMGFQVSFRESLRTRGVTFNQALFRRQGLHTAFLGGGRDLPLMALEDDAIGRIAAQDLRHVTGFDAEVLGVSRTAVPAWDLTWTALERLKLPPDVHLCANYESRIGIPGRIRRAMELADQL